MRYCKFDVVALIKDFEKNKRTLASVQEALLVARGYLNTPAAEGESRGEVETYVELLELREHEFRLYVDRVVLGLNDLPEVERNVIKWWLLDNWSDERILYETDIESEEDLRKIKAIALRKFHDVIMPN